MGDNEVPLVAEGEALLDAILVGGMHRRAASQPAAAFSALGLHEVTAAGTQAQDFSARSNLEALGGGLLRFNAFWTSHKSSAFFQKERAISAAARPEASGFLN